MNTEATREKIKEKYRLKDLEFLNIAKLKLTHIRESLETEFYYFEKRLLNLLENFHLIKYAKKYSLDLKFLFKDQNVQNEELDGVIKQLIDYEPNHQEIVEIVDNCAIQLLTSEHKLLVNYANVCPTGLTLIEKYAATLDKCIPIEPTAKQQHSEAMVQKSAFTPTFNQPSLKLFSLDEYRQVYELFESVGKKLTKADMIYRASDHDFRSKKFKEYCSKMEKTMTIVRAPNNYIFGGFTPCRWIDTKEKEYIPDSKCESFLFSLNNQMVFPIKKNQQDYAISSYGSWGPIFGSPYGPDLSLSDQCNRNEHSCSSLGSHYEIPPEVKQFSNEAFSLLAGSKKFKVVEYEVYEVQFEQT